MTQVSPSEETLSVQGRTVPVLRPKHWQNVQVLPGFTVSYQKVSDHILLNIPSGIPTLEAINGAEDLRREFLAEMFVSGDFIIEIKDYHAIPGLPSLETRNRQAEIFLNDAPFCRGVFTYGQSPLFRTTLHVSLLLHKVPYPFELCSSREDALTRALQLEAMQSRNSEFQDAQTGADYVDIVDVTDCSFRFWVRKPNIMGIDFRGYFRESHLSIFLEKQRRILSLGILDINNYYRIFDVRYLEKSEWSARFHFASDLQNLHEEFGTPQMSVVVGASPFLRASLYILLWFSRRYLRFADTPEDALAMIELDQQPTSVTKAALDTSRPWAHEMEPDLAHLMEDIGNIHWQNTETLFPNIPREHRLRPIYDALELVALDNKQTLEQRDCDREKIMQAYAVLEETLKSRTEFLHVAQHEIRTPLNGLIGMLDLARQNSTDPEICDYLNTAKQCADNLMSMMTNLLDLSSIEAGRLQLQPTAFSMAQLLNNLEHLHRPLIMSHGVTFQTNYSGDLETRVFGDQSRLSHVLDILLQNAIQFTTQGTITLSCRADMEDQQILFEFTVQDSGKGIPSDELSKIFEPFYQADPAFSRRYGAIGLGLTMVDQLVRMLGGTIKAESRPGEGSRFLVTVRMPIAKVS